MYIKTRLGEWSDCHVQHREKMELKIKYNNYIHRCQNEGMGPENGL